MQKQEAIRLGKKGTVQKTTELDRSQRERALRRRARSLGILPAAQQVPPPPAADEGLETAAPAAKAPADWSAAELEKGIEQFFEKIHRGADFLPASFLEEGASRARAVCRITAPHPTKPGWITYGTGFLVADGVLMTNNHVLATADLAKSATAEFDYAEGLAPILVAVDPGHLFMTDEDLDYTIVGCDTTGLDGLPHVPLLRDPATVVANERVNIVQHPAGRKKEVALHDNRIIDASKVEVVRYRTDTEGGSSGSPVFNNEWDLVALHHAGWREGETATNEGIRISAIVTDLLRRLRSDGGGTEAAAAVAEAIGGISPMLGFFDTAGLVGDDGLEVEVPDFQGDTRFADVGFWNIEHFRDDVSDTRLEAVADVVAGLAMDVMGLVEVQAGALDRLVVSLTSRGYDYGHVVLDVPGSQDLALLHDRDTTRVELRTDLNERHRERLQARTAAGKTAFPREPLFAKCTVDEGDSAVEFLAIVLHLKAFGDAQSRSRRRLAATKLAEIVEDIRSREGLPVVLGGDYNELLTNDVLTPLTDSPDLFALTADDAVSGAISYVGGSHRSLIDHVIVSSDVRLGEISGDDAAIVRLDRSIADFAGRVSDHAPIAFRMIYRDAPIPLEPTIGGDHVVSVPEGAGSVHLSFGPSEA